MAEQHTYENVVLLYDRGLMDGEAYLSHEEFESIIINNGYVKKEIRDNRYDLIIHLVTAANGAEAFYTLENNQTRKETIEEARILDKKTQAAWQDHPNLHIIDNSTPFAEKVDRTIEKINSFLKYFTQ